MSTPDLMKAKSDAVKAQVVAKPIAQNVKPAASPLPPVPKVAGEASSQPQARPAVNPAPKAEAQPQARPAPQVPAPKVTAESNVSAPTKPVTAAASAPAAQPTASAPPAAPVYGELLKITDEPPSDPRVAQELAKEPEACKLFRIVMKMQASDLHLKVGQPPMMRLRGDIRRCDMRPLTQEDMERLMYPLLTPKLRKILDDEGGVDFSYVIGQDECRFRVSLFRQRNRLSLVARRVNSSIPTFEKLGLPPVIEKLCNFPEGLVILAGVTGSGKSTTIASMLDYVNSREALHILTVEDPIEFIFTDKMAYINQREIGLDSRDWHKALKDAVRQDPDVILVGELRDIETFEAAVHAAETGHLVFGTIHAASAATTINRIMDLFPPEKHPAIRQALANNLKAVVAQKLVKSIKPGTSRLPTNEVMIVNAMIRELIARGEDKKIPDAIRIGFQDGMMDFNENLRQLAERGDIEKSVALEFSPNPDQLKMMLKGIKVATPGIL